MTFCCTCLFNLGLLNWKHNFISHWIIRLFLFPGEGPPAEGDEQAAAQTPAPAPPAEEKPQSTPTKTPKSPAKSEPQTPSKKVKEIPPIPTFDLYMVLAAGKHGNASWMAFDKVP